MLEPYNVMMEPSNVRKKVSEPQNMRKKRLHVMLELYNALFSEPDRTGRSDRENRELG